ncbi:hypothetical protein Hanom_Chr04g00335561 [Helianthus anomalus]
MSSAAISSKSASKFGLSDIQDIVSPRSIKKELAASQSIPETRGKGSKRKKPSESSEGLPLIERQHHEAVSEESKTLQKQILLADITTNKERLEIIDDAKKSTAIVTLKIRLQMAKEAADPSFDRSAWNVEAWKQRLQELGDDEEPEEVLTIKAGGSGSKDPLDAIEAGGSGEGGEAKADETAKE